MGDRGLTATGVIAQAAASNSIVADGRSGANRILGDSQHVHLVDCSQSGANRNRRHRYTHIVADGRSGANRN